MIDQILNSLDLRLIARHTTKGNTHTDDLTQELTLSLLEMNREKLTQLYNDGKLKAYVYRMANFSYNGHLGQFYLKYRRKLEYKEEVGLEISLEDVLNEADLTEFDRLWLQIYMEQDCKYVNVEKETGISRQHSSKRIRETLKKCRKR